jgi:hypothetical protein
MNYTKPEVSILGEAKSVVESLGYKPASPVFDGTKAILDPAYDLDE